MTNFLDRIFETLRKLTPRLELIQPDEAGVRVTLGKYEKVLRPGFYFLWEIFQTIHSLTVTPCWVDLRGQSVFAKHGQNMVVSGAIRYRITDARKALLTINDIGLSHKAQHPFWSRYIWWCCSSVRPYLLLRVPWRSVFLCRSFGDKPGNMGRGPTGRGSSTIDEAIYARLFRIVIITLPYISS